MAELVEQRVRKIVSDILDVPATNIDPAVRFRDFGASSIDFIEIITALETEFDVEISDGESPNLNTVDKLVDFLEGRPNGTSQ